MKYLGKKMKVLLSLNTEIHTIYDDIIIVFFFLTTSTQHLLNIKYEHRWTNKYTVAPYTLTFSGG